MGYKYFDLRRASGRNVDSKMKVSLPLHKCLAPVGSGPCTIRWWVTKHKLLANKKSTGGLQRNGMGAVWSLSLLLCQGEC